MKVQWDDLISNLQNHTTLWTLKITASRACCATVARTVVLLSWAVDRGRHWAELRLQGKHRRWWQGPSVAQVVLSLLRARTKLSSCWKHGCVFISDHLKIEWGDLLIHRYLLRIYILLGLPMKEWKRGESELSEWQHFTFRDWQNSCLPSVVRLDSPRDQRKGKACPTKFCSSKIPLSFFFSLLCLFNTQSRIVKPFTCSQSFQEFH